jgi:hypothetical protein
MGPETSDCTPARDQEFCQGASLVTGGQAGVRWPQILTHVASGALHSVPLPHEHWLSLHHPTVADGHQVVCLAQEASTGLVDNLTAGSSKRRRYHGEDHPYSSLLARLRTVLAEKGERDSQADEGKLPRRTESVAQ